MPCSRFNAFHLFTSLKLDRPPACSLLPSSLCLDHSHCLVLAPATLAALPSTRAIPDRDVFYVARPARSILLPFSFRYHRRLALNQLMRIVPGPVTEWLINRGTDRITKATNAL